MKPWVMRNRTERGASGGPHINGSVALVLGLIITSSPSWASTFDEESGRLDLSDAVFALSLDSFEETPASLEFMMVNTSGAPVSVPVLNAHFESAPDGLEGTGALSFGGTTVYGNILLGRELPESLEGRRIEVRLWQRPRGTRARVSLSWYGGEDPRDAPYLGSVPLLPTGRATDDGWLEFSTGPVDFAAGGAHGAMVLSFVDAQVLAGEQSYFLAHDTASTVLFDALEVLDLGPAAVTPERCTALTEAEICGDAGLCHFGRCVDAALAGGPLPSDEYGLGTDYFTRRAFEYHEFEGGRIPQENMASLEAAFTSYGEATTADLWTNIRRAAGQLRDGHVSTPVFSSSMHLGAGVCLHLGEADLLPSEYGVELPLVFSTTGDNPFATELEVGDVLVEIDGLTPEDWSTEAWRFLTYPGDPDGFSMFTAPWLIRAAILSGATMTFARCARDESPPTACSEDELERIEIDLYELVGEPLWNGEAPRWPGATPPLCDYRFSRALEDDDIGEFAYAGSIDEEGVRTLIINAVPGVGWDGGAHWHDIVGGALDPAPERLILDQRRGDGGSIQATDFLAAQLLAEGDFFAMDLLPFLHDEELVAEEVFADVMQTCSTYANGSCGGAWRWMLGEESERTITEGCAASTRVAIVNSYDASGNDYVSRLLSYRSGPTRIFGPSRTFGAFGPINNLPNHLDELAGGSLQHHDTLFRQTPDGDPGDFTTGIGVTPDEVVLQRQSDAIQNIDTMIERARSWLLEEGA